jgi:hypothetical protein
MTLPGETVATGADHPDTALRVLESAAGFYIGYLDANGAPYSRESGYYATKEGATADLNNGLVFRP